MILHSKIWHHMILHGKVGPEIQGNNSGMQLAGFVLAGGQSRRMGRDKALLQIDPGGPTLLEHAAKTVLEAVGNVTIVGAPERYGHLGWRAVADLASGVGRTGLGPMGGLETILKVSKTDWNLVVACDMPGLTAELLRGLIDSLKGEDCDCVVSQDSSGGLHPLCAVYHRRCLPAVERLISDKCFTLHRLIDNLRAKHWLVSDNLLLQNVNSPSDLRPVQESR